MNSIHNHPIENGLKGWGAHAAVEGQMESVWRAAKQHTRAAYVPLIILAAMLGFSGCDTIHNQSATEFPAKKDKRFDLDKFRVVVDKSSKASLILWINYNIESLAGNNEDVADYKDIVSFSIIPQEISIPDDFVAESSGRHAFADGVPQKTGRGISDGGGIFISKIEKEGLWLRIHHYWHVDEDNGDLEEIVFLPFDKPQEIRKGRLRVASSFDWKDDILAKAAVGDVSAQYKLGELYWHGEGFENSKEQAFSWYKKAAEQGNAKAQYMLAHMYSRGFGVAKDLVEAYTWYVICNKAFSSSGEDLRKRVSGKLTAEEIAKGEQRASSFMLKK